MAGDSFTITIREEVAPSLVFCRLAAGTIAAAVADEILVLSERTRLTASSTFVAGASVVALRDSLRSTEKILTGIALSVGVSALFDE
jgi:hypothetical protein